MINIIAVTTTSESIIPKTNDAEDKIEEMLLLSNILPIPEERERLIFHKNKFITEGKKIIAITIIA